MDLYNAAEWLLDRHVAAGSGDRYARSAADGAAARLRRGRSRRVEVSSPLLADLDVSPGSAWPRRGQRRARVPGGSSGPCGRVSSLSRCRRCRPGTTWLPSRRMLEPALRGDLCGATSDRIERDRRRLHRRLITSSSSSRRCRWRARGHRHGVGPSHRSTQVRCRPTGADDAGVLAVQLGHDRVPKGVIHRHASPQATVDTYATRVLAHRPRRSVPVRRQVVLRLRARQLADVPVRRRRHRILEPRRPTPQVSRTRACRAADALLRRARLRRRAPRRRHAPDARSRWSAPR